MTSLPKSTHACPDVVPDRHVAAAAFVLAHRRSDVDGVPEDARPAGQRRAQLIVGHHLGGDVRPPVAHGRDARRRRRVEQRAQPACAGAPPRRQQDPRHQPPGRNEHARVGHHPERVGRDRELAGGAEKAGGHLTGGEQAESELADSPAEPDRRLAQADAADRDLADRHDADGDLADRR